MLKDAFYFSHDSNAKDDPKISLVIEELGLEGYGIYWVLIETLREQPMYKYPIKLIPILARKYNTTTPKVEVLIRNYGLFVIENEEFFSLSLNKRMEIKEAKSLKARESANKRWIQTQSDSNANALQTQSDSNAIKESKVKKKKVKESKVNEFDFSFLENEILINVFRKWFKYKLEIKDLYKTQTSLETSFKQLKRFSDNNVIKADLIVEQSIANGWKGLFELKGNNNNSQQQSTQQPQRMPASSLYPLKND